MGILGIKFTAFDAFAQGCFEVRLTVGIDPEAQPAVAEDIIQIHGARFRYNFYICKTISQAIFQTGTNRDRPFQAFAFVIGKDLYRIGILVGTLVVFGSQLQVVQPE